MIDKIIWNSSFSVGVQHLDEQHHFIIDIINELVTHQDLSVNSQVISESLSRLTDYAEQHFRDEEQILKNNEYPDIEQQKESHLRYREKVIMFYKNAIQYDNSVPEEMLNFLIDWWKSHILEEDMQYKEYLRKRGVN